MNLENESLSDFSIILLGIMLLILVYATIGSLFEFKHFHYIHETGMGILIGGFFGLIVYFLKDLSTFNFNQQIFFYGLLPPMIFAGGYNLKKRKFGQNIKYIILFGLLGTIVSFGVIFGLTYFINSQGWIVNYSDSAVITLSMSLMIKFSATICATDSVAALTLIKPKDHPKLFSIIFGQGMVNDAVAIILFKVVGSIFDEEYHQFKYLTSEAPSDSTVIILLKILGSFLLTITASLVIGVGTALICSKMFAQLRFLSNNPVTEVVMIYLFGIMSYVIAEIADMSGVITVLVCGVCLAHFNFYNLSITGQLSTGVTFQSISFIAEAFVFVYLGISTIYYFTNEQISVTFLFLQLLICVISRMTAVFGLSFITKLITKKWLVSWYQLAIVSMAGTIRGSVAFALILTIEHHDVATSIVKSSTLMMVCITTIFLGALMPFFIIFCLKRDGKIPPKQPELSIEDIADQPHESLLSQDDKDKEPPKPKKKSFFKMLDQQYLKPFFIHDYVKRKPQIQEFKKLLKLNSPEYKGGQFVALMMAGARQTVATNVLSDHKFHADSQ